MTGVLATTEILSLLKRELMHAILLIVLVNPEFLEVYRTGMVFTCDDEIVRRFYPRFITYAADYPEKYVRVLYLLTNSDFHIIEL